MNTAETQNEVRQYWLNANCFYLIRTHQDLLECLIDLYNNANDALFEALKQLNKEPTAKEVMKALNEVWLGKSDDGKREGLDKILPLIIDEHIIAVKKTWPNIDWGEDA